MKLLSVILLIFVSLGLPFSSFGQDYKDTLNAARSAYKNGSYKQALKYYKSAERLAPKEVDLSQEEGQAAYKAEDYETAKRCFDQLASKSKSNKQSSKYHSDSGLSSMKKEDYNSSIESCKEALRRDPSNETARQILVESKRLQKQKEEKEKQQEEKDKKDQNEGDDQNNDGGQDKQDGDQKKSDDQSKSSKSNKEKNDKSSSDSKPQEATLEDRQTERKLDELSKQDLDAKRRMNGSKGSKQGKGSKNDW